MKMFADRAARCMLKRVKVELIDCRNYLVGMPRAMYTGATYLRHAWLGCPISALQWTTVFLHTFHA